MMTMVYHMTRAKLKVKVLRLKLKIAFLSKFISFLVYSRSWKTISDV